MIKQHTSLKQIIPSLALVLVVIFGYGQGRGNSIVRDKKPTNYNRKNQVGVALGFGQSKLKHVESNWQQGITNYYDSLNSIESDNIFKFDVSIIYQLNFNNFIAFRPEFITSFEGGQLTYNKKNSTEKIKVPTVSSFLSMPVIIKLPAKNIKPYIGIGPSLGVTLAQGENDEPVYVPLKSLDILGEFLTGIEWNSRLMKSIVSIEVKFSTGFLNIRSDKHTLYTDTIESLKREALTFRIAFRL